MGPLTRDMVRRHRSITNRGGDGPRTVAHQPIQPSEKQISVVYTGLGRGEEKLGDPLTHAREPVRCRSRCRPAWVFGADPAELDSRRHVH